MNTSPGDGYAQSAELSRAFTGNPAPQTLGDSSAERNRPRDPEALRAKIEQTAQGILDARARYPESSLADLYDPLTMPADLRKAHEANDRAVMAAYGFNVREMSEADCVAALMRMYQQLTA